MINLNCLATHCQVCILQSNVQDTSGYSYLPDPSRSFFISAFFLIARGGSGHETKWVASSVYLNMVVK